MGDALTTSLDASLRAIAAVAVDLEPVMPSDRRSVLRDEAAVLLDGLLVRLARGSGALDVALGEALDGLSVGDRLLRLGFSGLGDYARERLGIAASTAEKLARLARALRDRPLLQRAVRTGLVTARKAEAILPVARGEAEAPWVERARGETVRALQAAVKAAGGDAAEAEEAWVGIGMPLPGEVRARLDEALALAGQLLGATAPRWQRVEAICQEFLSSHPDGDEGADPPPERAPVEVDWDEVKGWLERETAQWRFLDELQRRAGGGGAERFDATPEAGAALDSVGALDARLLHLAGLRGRTDELFGKLAMLLRQLGLWRDMQFASFGHYCTERLGCSERAVAQRAALERRFYELPALREALRGGRLSYEKVRLVASCASEWTVDRWIERAEGLTCIALAREVEADEDRQMCARSELRLRLPVRVAGLLDAALRAAQRSAGRPLQPGEALLRILDHFIETWRPALAARNTLQRRVLARDRGRCQVPGCSRAALQVHHVVYRARGGADAAENLVSLCAGHHLHGIHRGWVRLRGQAPGRLRWEVPGLRGAERGAGAGPCAPC